MEPKTSHSSDIQKDQEKKKKKSDPACKNKFFLKEWGLLHVALFPLASTTQGQMKLPGGDEALLV